jgi:RsiW-degrading membrane proteinase PrsW (M82 family)
MNILLTFFPVLLFLAFLFLLDSFKLVRVNILILCLLCGILSAVASYGMNTSFAKWFGMDFNILSKYLAPVIEETLKAIFIFYLISKKKIGFMIDGAIYGFAIGTGFSLLENIWYLLNAPPEYNLLIWIIRGFGTAIMHGGCTSLLAVLVISGLNRSENRLLTALPGLLFAILLHAAFNLFLLTPILQTLLIIILLPVTFVLVFGRSNARLQQWLEIEFNSEVELLNMIRKGGFRSTKAGSYLLSLRERFTPETIVDMYCYIDLYLELSIKAKRNLMLKENDFPVIVEDDLQPKMKELVQLRKQIGKVGELALAPLIRMNYRTLWKLNQLIA